MQFSRLLPLPMLGVLLLAACGVPAAAADEPNNAAEGFAEPGGYTTTVGATTTDAPTTQAPTTNLPTTVVPTTTSRKVFVCKFVDIPGVGERLQSGQNPISVSVNAIPLGNVKVGSEFADRHGRSLVIAFDVGQPEPDPSECLGGTTTTATYPHATTTTATSTSTSTSTTQPATTTSTSTTTPTTTTSAPPAISLFGITPIGSSCTADVPFIDIRFGARTDLDGRTGSLAIFDLNGNLIETRGLTYRANTTVRLIYPGATTDAQGIATDWPGWVFTNGVWVPDPTDAAWRDGLRLVYTLDGQTASAQVTYPPDTATCSASPPIGPVPSGATTTLPGPTTTVPGTTVPGAVTTTTLPTIENIPPVAGAPTTPTPPAGPPPIPGTPGPTGLLPTTGSGVGDLAVMAVLAACAGGALLLVARRRREA